MSYFKHAYPRAFLGNKGSQASNPGTAAALDEGFIMEAGINSAELKNANAPYSLGTGTFGFFTKDGWLSVDEAAIAGNNCCPLVLASAAIKENDKEGHYHGGYQESNKSKFINPKRITEYYRVDPCVPQNAVVHVGNTNATNTLLVTITDDGAGYTDGSYTGVAMTGGTGTGATANIIISGGEIISISIADPGTGYVATDTLAPDTGTVGVPGTPAVITVDEVTNDAACCFEFYCDETYYLRLDVKGSPALRFVNHNMYWTVDASGGCCDGPVPTVVNSTNIMIQWAKQIVREDDTILGNKYLRDFIKPIVYDEAGAPWFYTAEDAVAAGYAATQIWDNYDQTTAHVEGACAGLRLEGAFVETKFLDCTFQVTDHYEREPIQIFASMVDYIGDPCVFEGICVVTECEGRQGMGYGESALRSLIMSESYLQNRFHSDLRIREITQGIATLAAIDRSAFYTCYYIQHNVPRNNNPSGMHDNDQYLLEVITNNASAGFESFMDAWLDDCGECTQLKTYSCGTCDVVSV